MDKEAFEALLDGQPKEIRIRGVSLFNGVATASAQYREAPTTATLKNWNVQRAEFDAFVQELTAKNDPAPSEPPLRTQADVLAWLKEGGWKITKATLSRHFKEGKLHTRADGKFDRDIADRYARTWLKQTSTGKRLNEDIEDLQRRKLELELKNLEIENKRKSLAYDKDMERYIPREQVEIELAGRAGVLEAGLKHMAQSRTAEWIRACGGNTAHVADLIRLVTADIDEHLNSYAAPIEYRLVIEADEAAERADEQQASQGEINET